MVEPKVYEIIGGKYKTPNGDDKIIKSFLVDPNPISDDVYQQEDLYLYVSLVAKPKSRSIIQDNESSSDEFYSSGINYDKPISFITTTVQNGKEYLTTNYFEIDGSKSHVEGFGLKNIEISIGADFTPSVSINFHDTRSGSFREFDDYGSTIFSDNPLSTFFKLPYPIFELTIKGFYGKPVTYCLNLLKFSATHASDNGGCDIKAEFIGYTYAFLTDIPIKYIWAISNTDVGRNILNENGILPFSDMLSKFGQLTRITDDFKENSDEFEKLKYINSAISLINNVEQLIGKKMPNGDSSVFSNKINASGISKNVDQVIIRDVAIINSAKTNEYIAFRNNVISKIDEYNVFVRNNLSEKYSINTNLTVDNIEHQYNNIIDILNSEISNNETFSGQLITLNEINKEFRFNSTTPLKDLSVYIVNFYTIRKNIQTLLINLLSDKQKQEDFSTKQLNEISTEKIGFNPTIENVFEIICGNVDAYMKVLYDYSYRAASDQLKESRVNNLIGLNTDINLSNNVGTNVIYPFPDVIKNDGEKMWLGDVNSIDVNAFPEIELTHLILNGINKSYNDKSKQTYIEKVKTNITLDDNSHIPIHPLDFNTIEYGDINSIQSDDFIQNNTFVNAILNRYFIVNTYGYKSNVNLLKFAKIEAYNLYNNITNVESRKIVEAYQDFTNSIINYAINNEIIDSTIYDKSEVKIDGNDVKTSPVIFIESDNATLLNDIKNNTPNVPIEIFDTFISMKKDNSYHSKLTSGGVLAKDLSYQFWSYDVQSKVTQIYTEKYLFLDNNQRNNHIVLNEMDSLLFLEDKGDDDYGNDHMDTVFNKIKITNSTLISEENSLNFLKQIHSFDIINNNIIIGIIDEMTKNNGLFYCSKLNLLLLGGLFKYEDSYANNSNISQSFKDILINYFVNWTVNESLELFQLSNDVIDASIVIIAIYYDYEDEYSEFVNNYNNLLYKMKEVETVVVSNSNFTITPYINSLVDMQNYISVLHNEFIKLSSKDKIDNNANDVQTTLIESIVDDVDFRLATYDSLKSMYDKWISYGAIDGRIYNNCFSNGKNENFGGTKKLIDTFHFIDKAWNNIGDKAVINPNILINLSHNPDETLYGFITSILNDSNFNVFFAPTFIGHKTKQDLKDMFMPQQNLSKITGGSSVIAMYIGGNSKHLNIPKSQYKNDGVNFLNDSIFPKSFIDRKLPNRLSTQDDETAKYNLSTFLVEIGKQNQQHFKSVDVGSEEHYNTHEYLQALSGVMDRGGKVKKFYKGMNIYNLHQIRSYKSSVKSMLNMMIQPMSYYQLNIPLFQGVYAINKVRHTISPTINETTFEGYRIPAYNYPIVDEITSFIKLLPDEVYDIDTFSEIGEINEDSNGNDSSLPDLAFIANQADIVTAISNNNILFEYNIIK